MARPTLLTTELIEKAKGYLDTCQDSYRRFEEVAEDEAGTEICEDPSCDRELCEKEHDDVDGETKQRRRRSLYRYSPHYRRQVELPSIAGLAVYLGVSRTCIYEWRDAEGEARTDLHDEFSYILDAILAEQEKRLINNGLSGTYNANIAKLALGKHGYSDKTDITSGDKPVQASPEAQAMAATAIASFLTTHGKPPATDTPATPGQ